MSADLAAADAARYAHALIGISAAEMYSGSDVFEALDKLAEAQSALRELVEFLDRSGGDVDVYSDGRLVASRVALGVGRAWWFHPWHPVADHPTNKPGTVGIFEGRRGRRRVIHTGDGVLDVVNDVEVGRLDHFGCAAGPSDGTSSSSSQG